MFKQVIVHEHLNDDLAVSIHLLRCPEPVEHLLAHKHYLSVLIEALEPNVAFARDLTVTFSVADDLTWDVPTDCQGL